MTYHTFRNESSPPENDAESVQHEELTTIFTLDGVVSTTETETVVQVER